MWWTDWKIVQASIWVMQSLKLCRTHPCNFYLLDKCQLQETYVQTNHAISKNQREMWFYNFDNLLISSLRPGPSTRLASNLCCRARFCDWMKRNDMHIFFQCPPKITQTQNRKTWITFNGMIVWTWNFHSVIILLKETLPEIFIKIRPRDVIMTS